MAVDQGLSLEHLAKVALRWPTDLKLEPSFMFAVCHSRIDLMSWMIRVYGLTCRFSDDFPYFCASYAGLPQVVRLVRFVSYFMDVIDSDGSWTTEPILIPAYFGPIYYKWTLQHHLYPQQRRQQLSTLR